MKSHINESVLKFRSNLDLWVKQINESTAKEILNEEVNRDELLDQAFGLLLEYAAEDRKKSERIADAVRVIQTLVQQKMMTIDGSDKRMYQEMMNRYYEWTGEDPADFEV